MKIRVGAFICLIGGSVLLNACSAVGNEMASDVRPRDEMPAEKPPQKIVSAQEIRAMWGETDRYWVPSEAEVAGARSALTKALEDGSVSNGKAILRDLPNCALTFAGGYRAATRVIEIIIWGGWKETGGPLMPNVMNVGRTGKTEARLVYILPENRVVERYNPK